MDLAAAFLLSLLGGYCFAYVWRGTRFTTRRVDGHHLYFRAALCGALLFSIALALRIVLVGHFPAYRNFDSALVEYVRPVLKVESGLALPELTRRVEWVVTAIYSLLLGTVCGHVSNVFTPRGWAEHRSIGALYRFLLQARQESLPVSLTLNTSKVYIGLVVAAPDPVREPVVVPLLPILSGHRDPEGRLNLTTDYVAVYSALKHGRAMQLGLRADWLSQFALVIRADEIVTAALFSPAIYAELNPDWKQRIAEQNQTAPPQELIVHIRRPKPSGDASNIKLRHAAT
jgi:hypothetical protein